MAMVVVMNQMQQKGAEYSRLDGFSAHGLFDLSRVFTIENRAPFSHSPLTPTTTLIGTPQSATAAMSDQPQDEAPGPQPGDVLAVSNISQEDISPDASQGEVVKHLARNCDMLSRVMLATHKNVDRVETKLDTLSREVSDLKRQQAVDTSPYAKLFQCEEIKMVSGHLSSNCKQAPQNAARAVRLTPPPPTDSPPPNTLFDADDVGASSPLRRRLWRLRMDARVHQGDRLRRTVAQSDGGADGDERQHHGHHYGGRVPEAPG